VKRWEAIGPYERSSAWEGRLQVVSAHDARTDVCGHLHESSSEAMRCAQQQAARLNSDLTTFDPRAVGRMSPGYYLG